MWLCSVSCDFELISGPGIGGSYLCFVDGLID